MNKHQFKPRHWRLDFAVSLIVIGMMIYFLLNKINYLKINIEKENVNAQVQIFRLSLTESWLTRNITHKNTNLNAFENTNPMLLIAERPKNYIGELAKTPQDQKSVWFYDSKMHALNYVLSNGELIRYKFVKVGVGSQKNGLRNGLHSGLPNGGLDIVAIEE